MTYANAVAKSVNKTNTENGMKAFVSTLNANVDLFYAAGAMRGQDILPAFMQAFQEDEELALRISLWLRDVRGGAGERQLFRDILEHLSLSYKRVLTPSFIAKIVEVGRWDDLFAISDELAFPVIVSALAEGNALCAKWMPRKGEKANALRKFMELSPKEYRKLLVSTTNVVEQKMCVNAWDDIDYSKLPSLALMRNMKAFAKHSPEKFETFKQALEKGETKANVDTLYPHNLVRLLEDEPSQQSMTSILWSKLPNYVGDAKILPMVDVSGSMSTQIDKSGLTAMQVAISLGLYLSEKNTGEFKDLFLTFSEKPEFQLLKGNLVTRWQSMSEANWGMSTNLSGAINLVLNLAKKAKVPQEDMPDVLLIISDMQFDQATELNPTAHKDMRIKFKAAGYTMPKVIFWNVAHRGNAPVKATTQDVGLVSGFSPSIMKNVLAGALDNLTPEALMKQAIMSDRYDYKAAS